MLWLISDWKTYVIVGRTGSEGWQGNYNKILEGRKNCDCYLSTKIQERNQCHVFNFSVFLLCFSFVLLTIIRTAKWQRKHINKASNINKIINHNYEIMPKIKIWRHIEFSENLFNFELSRSLTFAALKYLYAHKTQISLWWYWLTWLSARFRSEKLTGVMRVLSQ